MNTSVYNNLISTFEPKYMTKYANNTHELRSVVKRIRKQTQTSPVYLLNFTNSKQSFVLGVKESSMDVKESLQSLSDESEEGVFSHIKARSSDIEQVGAELVSEDQEQLPSPFTIKVNQLANSQINQGKEYYSTGKGLEAGSYQFKVSVNDVGYDFQYNIRKDANNREVIEGLAGFITKARIGIKASPDYNGDKISMRLESEAVGTPNGDVIFSLEDKNNKSGSKGLVSYFGLNNVSVMPKSAEFELNGAQRTSLANEFTLGRAVKINLREVSDEAAYVDYHPDNEVIMSGVNQFVNSYNSLVGYSVDFSEKTGVSSKLLRELKGVVKPFESELESSGFTFDDDGFINIDQSLANQSIEDGDMQKLFSNESPFMTRLYTKMDSVKINPMEYVDKKIVTYPNFSKPPRGYSYITSLYSGLLFNSYC